VLVRIASAVLLAWCFAAVYSIIAIALFAASNGPGRFDSSLGSVVTLYWVGATLIGAIIGALQPLATTMDRRVGVAFVGIWPAMLAMYVMANDLGFQHLERGDVVTVTVISVVFAIWGASQKNW
jgi:hypothetical protein